MTYVEQPNFAQAPFGPPAPPVWQPKNGLGTAAMVLGILALLFGVIPILFFVTYVLGPLAIIFGIIGIVRVGKRVATNRGAAIAGLVTGILGLTAAIIWTAAWGSAANDLSKSLPKNTVSTAPGSTEDSGAATSSDAGPTNLPLGQAITATSSGTTTQITVTRQQRQGGELGFLVSYTCTAGSCDYNPFDWRLRANDGSEYNQSFSSDGFGQTLNSGQLNTGSKAQGWVTFTAPSGGYTAEYTGSIFSTPATWVLP